MKAFAMVLNSIYTVIEMHEYFWKNSRWMVPKMAPIPVLTVLDAQLAQGHG